MLAKRIGVSAPVLPFSLFILALIGSGCASTPQPAPEPAPPVKKAPPAMPEDLPAGEEFDR